MHKFKASMIASALMLMPFVANAAGLGKMTVTSALGQPLRAEIELIADSKEDVSTFAARMAPNDAFRQAGIEKMPGLTNVRFSIEKRPSGQHYLRVTSAQPINEPFMALLVELNWPNGRLVREYTVLLDPPGFTETAPVAAAAAPTVKKLPETAKPARSARASKSTAAATPAERTFPNLNGEETQPAPASKATAKETTTDTAAADTYGPVKKGDTLAEIANKVKPSGVSLDQMLVSLYQANRDAFAGDNMNRLKTGQILKVPDAQTAASVGRQEAAKQVKAHAADWNAYRQKLAASVGASEAAAPEESKQAASGKITAAVEDKAAAKPSTPQDVLKLSKGEAAVKSGDVKALQDRINALQEEAVAREKTIGEANARIGELEKNIKEMQRLLELKSQSLAELQNQGQTPGVPTTPATPAPPSVPTEGETAPPTVAEQPASQEPLVKAIPDTDSRPSAVQPAAPAAKTPTTVPEVETHWYDEILGNPLYLGGAAALLILGGLLWLVVLGNRRRKSLTSFEDSIMTGGDLKANTVLGDTGGGVVDTGDTSFLTDFSQAGLGTIDTNDVDPIAEAEVYMAYGRDAQAEEILKEAMAKDPNRHEIHLKLLEIYASRKNLAAFETLATELYAATGGKPGPIWDKVAQMGRELDPSNPLYSGRGPTGGGSAAAGLAAAGLAGAATAQQERDPTPTEIDAALELNPEAPEFTSPESVDEPDPLALDGNALDFDLGLDEATPAQGKRADATSPEAELHGELEEALEAPSDTIDSRSNAALADDVDDIIPQAAERAAEGRTSAPQEVSANDDDNALDFDIDVPAVNDADPAAEAGAPEQVAEEPEATEEEPALDFDFSIDEDASSTEATPAVEPHTVIDLEDLSLDLDETPTVAQEDTIEQATEDRWGEAATKLDLAKAYMEMGDREGAREILQEVIAEGSPEQQGDAKGLLAELS